MALGGNFIWENILKYWKGKESFFCLLNQDTDYRIAIVDYFSLAAAIIRDGHMPDMNFSTWNHACSKVHEILELQEHIQIILSNISWSSVKSMPKMLGYSEISPGLC